MKSAADKEAAFKEAGDRKWERAYTAATKVIAQEQAKISKLESELAEATALLQLATTWPAVMKKQYHHWHLKALALLKSKDEHG